MNIKTIIFSMVLLSAVCTTNNVTTCAISKGTKKSFEEGFIEHGYKYVHDAKKDFETHIGQDVKLPLKVPPITFTHCFGRINDGGDNVSLEVRCLNDKLGKNHYKMYVRPMEDKLPIVNNDATKLYKLRDGSEVKFINNSLTHEAIFFERYNLQYMLSIDNRISGKVTSEVLVEIANSIDYPREEKNELQ